MERQPHHAEQVVGVEPGSLAIGVGPQGEEILEDAPVDDDAADQRHQHEHAGDADDVESGHAGVEVVVQGEPEAAAQGFRQGLPGHRIEGEALELALVRRLVTGPPEGFALTRRTHPERVGIGCLGQQPVAHLVDGQRLLAAAFMQRRTHPAFQLLVEAGDAAAEQNDEEQPGRQQSAPGVQSRHGLAQAHGRTPKSPGR